MRNKPPHPPQSCPPQSSSPEHVELDSSSLFPQSLSPSHSQRLGMQRLFLHLKRSEGQVCWSVGGVTRSGPAHCPPQPPDPPAEALRTAQLGRLVAVIQAVVVPVAFPALLDAAVVLAGELSGLALRRGDVGGVGCKGKAGKGREGGGGEWL